MHKQIQVHKKDKKKKILQTLNKRLQDTDNPLVTSDTLNRLPAVDGLGSFHSLSNTDTHTNTSSAKHLLF